MDAIRQLEGMGYVFTLEGDNLRYTPAGPHPDPALARPLLEALKAHKAEALEWLRARDARPVNPAFVGTTPSVKNDNQSALQPMASAADWDGSIVEIANWAAFKAAHNLRQGEYILTLNWGAESHYVPPAIKEPSAGLGDLQRLLSNFWESWWNDTDESRGWWHARRYTNVAIRLGLPFYDEEGNDLGAHGWGLWYYMIKYGRADNGSLTSHTIGGTSIDGGKGEFGPTQDNSNTGIQPTI